MSLSSLYRRLQACRSHDSASSLEALGASSTVPGRADGTGVSTVAPVPPFEVEVTRHTNRPATRRERESAMLSLRLCLYTAADSLRPLIAAAASAEGVPPEMHETLDRIELTLAYAQIQARFVQHDIDGCVDYDLAAAPATHEHGFYGALLADLCVNIIEGDPMAGSTAKRGLLDYAGRQLAWRLNRQVGATASENQTCSTFGLRGLHRLIVEVRDYDAEAVLFALLSHLKPTLCGFGRGAALDRPRSFYARLAWYRQRYPDSTRKAVDALFWQVLDRHYADALHPDGPRAWRTADYSDPTAALA